MQLFGRLYTPADSGLCELTIEGPRIAAIERAGAPSPGSIGDAGARIVPGLIDIQVNGAFGQDFSDPAADVDLAARGLPRFGVTGFLPTIITSPLERYLPCLRNLDRPDGVGARVLGVHLEGPFLSPAHPGTHDPAALRAPDADLLEGWLESGSVRIVTLAPELDGALPIIERLRARGIVAALGHSDAHWAEGAAAGAAGAALGTHLFNAMRPLHHRDPALPGFLLASSLPVSVIADGIHLAPETLQLVGRVKAPDELIVITDALAGLGMPEGPYELAGRTFLSDGVVGRLADGTLSGSVLPLNRALRNLVRAGLEPAAAVQAATANPARLLQQPGVEGVLRRGGPADAVLLDEQWEVLATVIGGELAYRREASERAPGSPVGAA